MLDPSVAPPLTLPQSDTCAQPLKNADPKGRLEYNRISRTTKPLASCPSALHFFNDVAELVSVGCDQWKCLHCQKLLAYRWAERIRYGIALWDGPAYFWTLTLPGWVNDPKVGYRELPKRWNNFRMAIKRQSCAAKFYYAAFVEEHPKRKRIPHLHIVSLLKAPKRLKDMAYHAGFGYQAKDIEITGKQAAAYVSKYVSKQSENMPYHFRRVRISQTWPRLPEPLSDHEIYPMFKNESVDLYLHRMVLTIGGVTIDDLRARWEYGPQPQP